MAEFTDHETDGRKLISEALAQAGLKPGSVVRPNEHIPEDPQAIWGPHGEGCLCEPDMGLVGDADMRDLASFRAALAAALDAGIPIDVIMPFRTGRGRLFMAAVPLAPHPERN